MHTVHTITISGTADARLTSTLVTHAQIAGVIAVVALIGCMFGAAAYVSIENAQHQAVVWRSLH